MLVRRVLGVMCNVHTYLPTYLLHIYLPMVCSYGSTDTGYTNADGTWDALMMHGCHCDMKDSMQPYMGPIDIISGVQVDNPKVGR